MRLPDRFIEEMKQMLGEEFDTFLESYDQARTHGLRVNTLKLSPEAFMKISPVELNPVPWCPSGFYYSGQESLTKHPYYHAGLFYIQEPTAMAPVESLDVKPGEWVLDLCSAPGGKTVQLAGKLQREGVVMANDINFNRLKAVIRNVEKYGITNAVIFNNTQQEVLPAVKGKIDRLLIDAPCSGEGMFRKDEKMVGSYESDDLNRYPMIQTSLLDHGARMLAEGGRMVYSTCTFNTRENEERIQELLGNEPGIDLESAVKMLPHQVRGEGHFVSSLSIANSSENARVIRRASLETEAPEEYQAFEREFLKVRLSGHFRTYKGKLYLSPVSEEALPGLNIVRNGLYLGELKRGRFEPAHALAMALKAEEVLYQVDFSAESDEVMKYLRGETIRCEGTKGYNLVTVDGYPLGWGKWQGGILKNKYPPAYRILK